MSPGARHFISAKESGASQQGKGEGEGFFYTQEDGKASRQDV